ncbi:MAG TPA: putative Fe-S cluster assembly protein SufT [Thermoanaerobaculia bacterium]|jgi:probable FeS assembly SUF system protein SufT|nr:putative Fe-S cluster assembly protein SufT [Thermoanaerobaculia bacterium]
MNMREEVTLTRNAEAVMIPSGEKVLVPEGAHATITQSLGGSYTLITERGLMVRISGKEVEAIGKPVENAPAEVASGEEIVPEKLEEMVWDQLKTCYDPEIPVNIVDLGLVYLCELEDSDGAKNVKIKMTLTAPGCGMGPVLASDVKSKVESLPGVKEAEVEVVFDPVWDRSMMSEAAKLQLGMMY